jgi:hypothetical protein
MVRQRRPPGVQHQRRADLRTQMLRIGSNGAQRLGRHLEQQTVDHRLVGVGDGADRRRQGKHQVVIRHRQQIGLTGFKPALRSPGLALRAMPVAAGVVADFDMRAGIAAQHMSPQRRRAALFDGRHDLELPQAQVLVLGLTPGRPKGAEDVRDLQGGTPHEARWDYAGCNNSKGLTTSRRMSVATCAYSAVVSSFLCPSRTWITRMSTFCSSRWVAKLWRLCLWRHRRHYLPFLTMSCDSTIA